MIILSGLDLGPRRAAPPDPAWVNSVGPKVHHVASPQDLQKGGELLDIQMNQNCNISGLLTLSDIQMTTNCLEGLKFKFHE